MHTLSLARTWIDAARLESDIREQLARSWRSEDLVLRASLETAYHQAVAARREAEAALRGLGDQAQRAAQQAAVSAM